MIRLGEIKTEIPAGCFERRLNDQSSLRGKILYNPVKAARI